MTAAAAVVKVSSLKLRKEIQDLANDLQGMEKEAEKKLVRLSNLVHEVQKKQLFREWIDSVTKKPFKSFEDWIKRDVKQSKSSVYRFIGVKEHLKLPDATIEKIGKSRCFELVRVAKEKPKMLQRIVKEIEKHPDMPVYAVTQMATQVLSDAHFDSGQYERFTFAVKVEEALDVRRAFMVMQTMEPVKNPESDAGKGMHLVNLCNDFLSRPQERKVLKRLEDAGAFKNGNTNFVLEED
jgi:hypothetical protein